MTLFRSPALLRRALLALLLAALLPSAHAAAATARPLPQTGTGYEVAECPMELPPGAVEGQDLECGYLTVPEEHANPSGPTIKLAVAVIRSTATNPAPDPLVMMQGGPGGSTLDLFVQLILLRDTELRAERDVVLFDQRGTLYSQPKLACPETLALTERTIEQRLSWEESSKLTLEAEAACRKRLVDEGVNLSAYDTDENAADVEALRQALGYDQINLYGVSYGTLLALTVMRNHPDGLRSVILDGLVPPQLETDAELARTADRALGELFTGCAADPACNAAYPDLETTFFETVEALNREPARVPLTDPETKKTYNAVIDGDALFDIVFQMLYQTDILPALPYMIDGARRGDFGIIQTVMPQVIFDRTFSLGLFRTVNCAADPDFRASSLKTEGVRPQVVRWAQRNAGYEERACPPWGVTPLPAASLQPVRSDIPTLLMSGRFDPVTPANFAEIAAETLPNSYSFTFGNTGHGALLGGECPTQIASAFLDNPTDQPDARCIDQQPAPDFLSPVAVRFTPVNREIIELLNGLEGGLASAAALQLLVLLAATLFLCSLYLFWPLAWFIRQVWQRPPVERPPGSRWVRGLALLAGPLTLLFVVGLVALIIQNETARPALLLAGVPRTGGVTVLFALPLLVALITVVMAVWIGRVWARGGWTLPWKLYFSLLTLAAVVVLAVLAPLGVFTVLLS
ncbi:MAG: hypothetical protein OHK0022_16740 [Roseiflexaceae bacterium]